MKPMFFLLWIAGGGLVAFETFICVTLLRLCETRQTAYDNQLWQFLLNYETAE